jgi:hypothetical protein
MRAALTILTLLWLGAYAASFWGLWMLEPTGDSFLRGANRLMAFLGWQTAAGVVGILLWLTGRSLPRGSPARWLSRVPVLLGLLLAVAIVGLIAWVNFAKPPPQTEPPANPVTAPAQKF